MVVFYPTLYYLSILFRPYAILFLRGDSMKPLKEKISITIDGDLLEKLKSLAEEDDRSLSQYINIALKEHTKNCPDQK